MFGDFLLLAKVDICSCMISLSHETSSPWLREVSHLVWSAVCCSYANVYTHHWQESLFWS